MRVVATVAELWVYPVKSMRGQRVSSVALDIEGLREDRRFALASSNAPVGKPLLSSGERAAMLLYTPSLGEMPRVQTPDGSELDLCSESLLAAFSAPNAAKRTDLHLLRSPERPLTDVRPVSLVSSATLSALSNEMGELIDPQRFRSNIVLQLKDDQPFEEERWSGHTLPLMEDRSAFQHSIGQVLQKLAQNELDLRRAGFLLYGLQIASLNLPPQKRLEPAKDDTTVDEITNDDDVGTIAPDAELIEKELRGKNSARKALEEWSREKLRASQTTATLPTLQAVADIPMFPLGCHPSPQAEDLRLFRAQHKSVPNPRPCKVLRREVHRGSTQLPATVIPSMRTVGTAPEPRNSRSFPIAETLRNMSFRFPAIVISSTACVSSPFSIHSPLTPCE